MKRRQLVLALIACFMFALTGCGGGGGGSDGGSIPSSGGTTGGGTSGGGSSSSLYGTITISAAYLPGDARNVVISGTRLDNKQQYSRTVGVIKAGTRAQVTNVPYGVYSLDFEYYASFGWVKGNNSQIGTITLATATEFVSLTGMKQP